MCMCIHIYIYIYIYIGLRTSAHMYAYESVQTCVSSTCLLTCCCLVSFNMSVSLLSGCDEKRTKCDWLSDWYI